MHEIVGNRLNLPRSEANATLDGIRSHRVAPGVFGRYYQCVLAIQGNEDDQARRRFLQLVDAAADTPTFQASLYTTASLGDDQQLFADLIDPNPGLSPWLCPPASDVGFERRVHDSLALIRGADPALADEIRGLAVQVVGAAPFHGPGARPLGSVSTLMLWGLMIVNLERYRTAADLVQGLVHEAAHLLLFAHSIEEPLVTNLIEERYTSPLRTDPRPMDGVFHATFVAARMHYVNRKLREATTATFQPVATQELDDRLATLHDLYCGGLRTVREHAKLTRTGRQVLEESLDYMQAA